MYPGLKASVSVFLPLRFRTGKFSQTFLPSVKLAYKNNYVFEEDGSQYDYGQLQLSTRAFISNLHRMSRRDIWPRWGQVLDASYISAPGDEQIYGSVAYLRLALYTPGAFRNHGIKLQGQFEKQDFGKLIQYNRISFPRGYNEIIAENIARFTADYTMPLLYPDLNIGSLLHIKRIRSTLYFDYARASENYHIADKTLIPGSEEFISYGGQLLADFHLLRIPFSFSGGAQLSWLPLENKSVFQLILSMDVFGFVINQN